MSTISVLLEFCCYFRQHTPEVATNYALITQDKSDASLRNFEAAFVWNEEAGCFFLGTVSSILYDHLKTFCHPV